MKNKEKRVSKTSLEIIYNEIKKSPRLIQERYLELLAGKRCRQTTHDAIHELERIGKIIKNHNNEYYVKEDEKFPEKINFVIPSILENETILFIKKRFSMNKINEQNLDSDKKYLLRKYISKMDNHFINNLFLNTEELNKDELNEIKAIMDFVKNSYEKNGGSYIERLNNPFELLDFIEKSLKNQLQVSLNTRHKIPFSNNFVKTIIKRIINMVFKDLFLNPEYASQIENIEDLSFNIQIDYDPIKADSYFNLDFISNEEIERLKVQILRYNEIAEYSSKNFLDKLKIESERREQKDSRSNFVAKQYENYIKKIIEEQRQKDDKKLESNLRKGNITETAIKKKEIMKNYFEFLEKLKTMDDYQKMMVLYHEETKNLKNIFSKRGDLIRQSLFKDLQTQITNRYKSTSISDIKETNYRFLLSEGKYYEALFVVDKYLEQKNLSKKQKLQFLAEKSRIFCDYLNGFEDALQVVEYGLSIDPTFQPFYSNKSVILRNMGKMEKSLDAIDDGLKIHKNDLNLLGRKARILLNTKQYKEAINVVDYALNLNIKESKDLKELLELKLHILQSQNRDLDTLDTLNQLINNFPNEVSNYIRKVEILDKEKKDYNAALETINLGLKSGLKSLDLYAWKSMILCDRLKDYKKALKAVEKGLNLKADNREKLNLLTNKSVILTNLEEYDNALTTIEEAERLNIKEYGNKLLRRKLHILKEAKRYEEAYDLCKDLLKQDQDNINLNIEFAEILAEMERIKEALIKIEDLMDKNPLDIDLIYTYAELIYNFKNNYKYYKKVLFRIESAISLAEQNKDKETVDELNTLLKEIEKDMLQIKTKT